MIDLTLIVPIIIAIVAIAKQTGLPSRFAPALSLILGVSLFALFSPVVDSEAIFEGIISGLTASGLWSGVKATIK
jgi:hypothetical protein